MNFEYNEAMEILMYQGHYGMNDELSNSQLINMDQSNLLLIILNLHSCTT